MLMNALWSVRLKGKIRKQNRRIIEYRKDYKDWRISLSLSLFIFLFLLLSFLFYGLDTLVNLGSESLCTMDRDHADVALVVKKDKTLQQCQSTFFLPLVWYNHDLKKILFLFHSFLDTKRNPRKDFLSPRWTLRVNSFENHRRIIQVLLFLILSVYFFSSLFPFFSPLLSFSSLYFLYF